MNSKTSEPGNLQETLYIVQYPGLNRELHYLDPYLLQCIFRHYVMISDQRIINQTLTNKIQGKSVDLH